MKTLTRLCIATAGIATLAACSSGASNVKIVDGGNFKQVGSVVWHKQSNIPLGNLLNYQVPQDLTSLVFIRRMDNDPDQTSANIAINGRFQVSLQPNSYTRVNSCAGTNMISVETTGNKNNDLIGAAKQFDLAPNTVNYFYVDVDDATQRSTLTQITKESAMNALRNKKYQSHQISRVVAKNCPPVRAPIPPQPVPPPVLEKQVRIEIDILFDTNEYYVKPFYYAEIEQLAEFMTTYPTTETILEGHTDSRASVEHNQVLSRNRANAVREILINRYNIAPNRLRVVGYGESRPRVPNTSPANLEKNRRVIAVINETVLIRQ